MRATPADFLLRMWRQYGDVVQFPIPRPGVFLLSSPTQVRSVLVDSVAAQSKRTLQYDNLALLTGNGLLTADDPPWRAHRRVVQPAFHRGEIASVVAHTATATEAFIRRWRDQQTDRSTGLLVDVDEAMMEISLQVVASALFGSDWDQHAAGLTKATIIALDEVVARARNPLAPPLLVPTKRNRRLRAAKAQLDSAVEALVSQYEEQQSHLADPTLLDLVMSGMRRPDGSLDRGAVRDELVTFLVAGHETVASALSWAWYLLSANPQVAADLRDEADRVPEQDRWTIDALAQLPLTRAVIDETLRLYPPAWVLTRRSKVEHEFDGHHIPTGSLLIMSPWVLGRHPDAWDRPAEFDPSRFLNGGATKNRLGYLPFGLGPRICIGREFALAEASIVLAMLAATFELNRPHGADPIEPLASVTLRPPNGLAMYVKTR